MRKISNLFGLSVTGWLGAALSLFHAGHAAAMIGGKPAPDLMAHTVMVLSQKGSVCSGALIAPTVILTAAHCVSDAATMAIYIRTGDDKPLLMQVKKVIRHPLYVADAISKRVRSIDLAVVHANSPLPNHYRPVAIAASVPKPDERVMIGGYGRTDEALPNSTGVFYAAEAKIVAPYGQSKILFWLQGEPIAGTDLARGACEGDSGGPVFKDGELIGITTWTEGPGQRHCGTLTQAAILSPQRAWIEQSMH